LTLDGTTDAGGNAYCIDYDIYGRLKGDVEIFWEPLSSNVDFIKKTFGSGFNPIPGVSATFPIFDLETPIFTGGHLGCDGGRPPVVRFAVANGSTANGPLPLTVTYDALGVKDSYKDLPGVDYSIDPDGGPLQRFIWDLDGDGHCEENTGSVGSASHTYTQYGDYNLSVWVVDDDGMMTQKTIKQTIAP